jgi:hypothetical protein
MRHTTKLSLVILVFFMISSFLTGPAKTAARVMDSSGMPVTENLTQILGPLAQDIYIPIIL